MCFFSFIFAAAIALDGVTGETLSARASFDVNNVRIGDPMVLTVDFIGYAEFSDIHPPALSKVVDAKIWKIDDASAKTDTYSDARRLVYRVRPVKEGLLEFPALEFSYTGSRKNDERVISTLPIPVHVKGGTRAALASLNGDVEKLAMPDGIVMEVESVKLDDDERFAWRKACTAADAAAFKAFDFPEARLNEAACEVVAGNWAKALKIYSRLEWQLGQTPAIERGIIAALARKNPDAAAELPAWRIVLRPLLAHAWKGRVASVVAIVIGFMLAVFISTRIVKAIAIVALALALPFAASAEDIFEAIDRQMRESQERINSMMQMMSAGGGMNVQINGMRQEPVTIMASVAMEPQNVRVGETFDFILTLEHPKGVTLDQLQFAPSERFGLISRGQGRILAGGKPQNPSNEVGRIAFPVRYDVPFKGEMRFSIGGMMTRRQSSGSGRGMSNFTFSQNFAVETDPVFVEIQPLPGENRPDDYSGAVGTAFSLRTIPDRTKVETNDVVTLRCILDYSGYVPQGALPDEIVRTVDAKSNRIEMRKYFIADGTKTIPAFDVPYYDTDAHDYKRVSSRPVNISYIASSDVEEKAVALDESGKKGARAGMLKFYPSDAAPDVGEFDMHGEFEKGETYNGWTRITTPQRSGWTRNL